jgi:hypothetical protein
VQFVIKKLSFRFHEDMYVCMCMRNVLYTMMTLLLVMNLSTTKEKVGPGLGSLLYCMAWPRGMGVISRIHKQTAMFLWWIVTDKTTCT